MSWRVEKRELQISDLLLLHRRQLPLILLHLQNVPRVAHRSIEILPTAQHRSWSRAEVARAAQTAGSCYLGESQRHRILAHHKITSP